MRGFPKDSGSCFSFCRKTQSEVLCWKNCPQGGSARTEMAGEITLWRWKKVGPVFALVLPLLQQGLKCILSEKSLRECGSQAALEFRLSPHIPQTRHQYNSLLTAKGETWSLCTFCHFNICSRTNPGLHTQQKACSPCSHCCLSPVLPFSYTLPFLSLHRFPLFYHHFLFSTTPSFWS